MNALSIGFIAIALYCLGTLHQAVLQAKKRPSHSSLPLILGCCALAAHIFLTVSSSSVNQSFNLNLVNSAAFISCIAVTLVIIISTTKPTQSMLLIIYPTAAASVATLMQSAGNENIQSVSEGGILFHISLSILAYSILSLAAIQALLVFIQNKNLKSHKHNFAIKNLPPLLTMENILFELIMAGTFTLSIAIAAGFIFVDNIFAQHLAHKTFFSLLSLIIFATLIIGRKRYGWRGTLASSLTLWGSALLMLGFFGSKFVLERMAHIPV